MSYLGGLCNPDKAAGPETQGGLTRHAGKLLRWYMKVNYTTCSWAV
jgi:hypothetical protein